MEQVFEAIPSVLKPLGPHATVRKAVVFAAWEKCAGELLRMRTAPVEFVENRLVVAVQDDIWRRHLEALSPQMVFRLNGSLGDRTVRFIEFRIDEHEVRVARKATTKVRTEEAELFVAPSLARAAEVIADEDLRKQFLGAAAAYLANQ